MSMKEILVHLDNTDRCMTRLDVAITLALSHQAHLTGAYSTSHPFSGSPLSGLSLNAEIESHFRQRTTAAGIAADWIFTDVANLRAGATERLILQAYYADLVIVGQADPTAGSLNTPNDLPEHLVIGSGRPVLVIPRFGEFNSIGQMIMLAWRGGKASSRALNDAIHFLEQAQQVNLLMVNPGEHFVTQADNLCTYLRHHGVTATVDRLSVEDVHAGDVLLNQACDLGIDLMVLGAVAHRRLGKTFLGPVGKHFLEHMTIPVLMSR
jgi:nucleotide-binding universal stress UspA family protein